MDVCNSRKDLNVVIELVHLAADKSVYVHILHQNVSKGSHPLLFLDMRWNKTTSVYLLLVKLESWLCETSEKPEVLELYHAYRLWYTAHIWNGGGGGKWYYTANHVGQNLSTFAQCWVKYQQFKLFGQFVDPTMGKT